MLLRTVSIPDTRSTNINSLAVYQVSVVCFVLEQTTCEYLMENTMLIKRNLQTEVRVALFGEVVEQKGCGHVSRCSGGRLESLLWRCSGPQLLVLSNTKEVSQGQ